MLYSKQGTLSTKGKLTCSPFFLAFVFLHTDLSGSVAEGLGHGDVTHPRRTGGLPVVQGLMSLCRPGDAEKKTDQQQSQTSEKPLTTQDKFLWMKQKRLPHLF